MITRPYIPFISLRGLIPLWQNLFGLNIGRASYFLAVLYIGFFGGLRSAFAVNYCGLTLNSSTEFDMFRKTYGEKDPSARFIELTDFIAPHLGSESGKTPARQWLKKACEAGVRCDVLLVSGHFAGDFFGRSQISISLEELEEASCDRSCDGIFKQPKEVFLLGCNTMAGKGAHTESMESYIARLSEHYSEQFSHPSQIERVAAFRYLPFGLSYADRMRRIFDKPVKVYGFDASAPTGKQIAPHLTNYFKLIGPSYDKHLQSLKKGVRNQKLAAVLKGSTFVEEDGLARGYAPVCMMKSTKSSKVERLEWIERSLLSEDWISYAPAISKYFRDIVDINSRQTVDHKLNQIFQRIRTNRTIYDRVVQTLKDPRFKNLVSIRFELVRLLEVLGFSSDQLSQNYRSMMLASFPSSVGAIGAAKQQLCSPDYSLVARSSLLLDDVKQLHSFYLKHPKAKGQVGETSQSWFTELMMCISPARKDVIEYFTDQLTKEVKKKNKDPNNTLFGPILATISQNAPLPGDQVSRVVELNHDSKVFAIESLMANQKIMDMTMSQLVLRFLKDKSSRVMMLQALTTSKTENIEVHRALLEMHKTQNLNAEGRDLLKRVVKELEPTHAEIQRELVNIYLKDGEGSIEPRALGRAGAETRTYLDSLIKLNNQSDLRRARVLRLLIVAWPSHPALKEYVLSFIGTSDLERRALVSRILSEALVTYVDKDVRDTVIKNWRSGRRIPGMVKYLMFTTQHNMDLLAELLDGWRGLPGDSPVVAELKSLVESRLAWRPELLAKILNLLEHGREGIQMYLVEFFRMADIPEEYRKDVVLSLEAISIRKLPAKVKSALLEILPVMRVDAGLKR